MDKASYSKNYLRSLFWQFLSLVTGILSLVIVTPLLSQAPSIYGMYTLTVSFSFFLSYADIGFVSAAVKYVSESYARRDLQNELKIEGFVGFILAVFIFLFSAVILYLSFNPELIVKDLNNSIEKEVISDLLLVQAIFAPSFILLRLLEIIFSARVEAYFLHRVSSVVSLLKIASVAIFINKDNYDIVGYYLLSQLLTLIGLGISLFIARSRYSIKIRSLLKNFRFDREILTKTKKIATNSLYITVVWFLFFEIDNLLIAKLLGPNHIAYYMIGFTVLSFFRSLFSIIFGPFQSRFNHFIGVGDSNGLKKLYNDVITISMPIIFLSITSFVIFARPLIFSWVGPAYEPSIVIAELLVLGYIVTFITQPTGIILTAEVKVKQIYWASTLTMLVFYIVLLLMLNNLGLLAFSIAKLSGFIVTGVIYAFIANKKYGFSFAIFKSFLPVFLFHILACMLIRGALPEIKSTGNTLVVASAGLIISSISLVLFYITSGKFKELIQYKFTELGIIKV
jgi:O-antigen/teichoic acid export membrane protein